MPLRGSTALRAVLSAVAIVFALVGGVTSQIDAQPVQSISKLTVVDANGFEVGTAFSNTNVPDVILQISGQIFALTVRKQRFVGEQLWFEAQNCAGSPFMRETDFVVPIAGIGAPGATAHLPDTSAPSQTKTFQSRFTAQSTPECSNESQDLPAFPAIPLLDLLAVFTPPFSVRPSPGAPVTAQIFGDVPPSHPYFAFVQALAAEGITWGCSMSPLLYCPDDPLTRGQAAVLFGRALNLVP